ncbi:hypothetical protein NM688_g4078 [Phlebia brevispora]|uniref:Uncharacterized protein n=1 Tax=Phlebia brevispora TaxID=194682 RepID=A0ACC1T4C5_9APHY|nr:hypothetical protein NM688_g4078 [Phlebia brevispora]
MYDDLKPPGQDPRWDVFADFHAYLQERFPKVHTALRKTTVNTWALVYHWQGADDSLKPVLLTAHQDVVPVEPLTLDTWVHPPFSGYYDGEWIWGRGSGDDKSGLVGVLTAIETLLEHGFQPTRTVVLAFGIDEERGGISGASAIGEYLLWAYGKDAFSILVDEGGGQDLREHVLFANPAVAEKGSFNLQIEVSTPGGHSSVPPPHTGIGILASLITELEAHPHATNLYRNATYYQGLQCEAAHDPDLPRHLKHLIQSSLHSKKALAKLENELLRINPQYKALTGTTQAVDIVQGGVKINALPERAYALVNHRIAGHSSVGELKAHIKKSPASGSDAVQFVHRRLRRGHWRRKDRVWAASGSAAWELLSGTIRNTIKTSPRKLYEGKEAVVAPSISLGNTDTKHYWDLTKHIFRYGHKGGYDSYNGAHTVNEAIRAEGFLEMIRFFTQLILNADETKSLDMLDNDQKGRRTPTQGFDHSRHASHSPSGSLSEPVPDSTEQSNAIKLIKRRLFFVADNNHLEACLATHAPAALQCPPPPDFSRCCDLGRSYYAPFAVYLNNCCVAARATYRSGDAATQVGRSQCAIDVLFADDFRWVVCDKEAISRCERGNELRPDLVGCTFEDPTAVQQVKLDNDAGVSWEDMITFAEVKNDWATLVARAATYVRQIFANQLDRVSVRCVIFNYAQKAAAIVEYDRAGGYATHAHDLTDARGCRQFSLLLAGMYCSSVEAHGYDRRIRWESNRKDLCSIQFWMKNGLFSATHLLCDRIGLWGRCTRAMTLVQGRAPFIKSDVRTVSEDPSSGLETSEEYVQTGSSNGKRSPMDQDQFGTERTVEKKASIFAYQPLRIISVRPKVCWEGQYLAGSLDPVNATRREPFVLVNYWSHENDRHGDDGAFMSDLSVLSKHGFSVRGLATYRDRYEARVTFFAQGPAEESGAYNYYYEDKREPFREGTEVPEQQARDLSANEGFLKRGLLSDPDAESYAPRLSLTDALQRGGTQRLTPYARYQTFLECMDVGRPLLEARNVEELVEGILGALYGYRNLFHLGYVHRDISPGNIILVDPEGRKSRTVVDIEPNSSPLIQEKNPTSKGESIALPNTDVNYRIHKVSESTHGMLIDMSLAINLERSRSALSNTPASGLAGTRIFIASRLLWNPDAQPSAIFDLESFLWVLLYVPLHQKRKTLSNFDQICYSALVPRNPRTYADDSLVKKGLMYQLKTDPQPEAHESVLLLYWELLKKMAALALDYSAMAAITGYDLDTEAAAIDKYIEVVESFLFTYRPP